MIVNYTEEGWEIITQRGHGLLAAEICARWKISDQPDRWVETLVACAQHDDAFNEFKGRALLTPTGGPLNFDMNPFDETLSQQLMDMALAKSCFIALLTAKHINFTHGSEPKAKAFIKKIKKNEPNWLRAAETTTKEVEQAYQLLEFCDAFSLLICQNKLQPESRSLEISSGPDGTKYQVICSGGMLRVIPWPFEINEFRVGYEVRKINQLTFKTDAELVKLLHSSLPSRVNLIIAKSLGK